MQLHVQCHTLFSQVLDSQTGRQNILAQLVEDKDFPYEWTLARFIDTGCGGGGTWKGVRGGCRGWLLVQVEQCQESVCLRLQKRRPTHDEGLGGGREGRTCDLSVSGRCSTGWNLWIVSVTVRRGAQIFYVM